MQKHRIRALHSVKGLMMGVLKGIIVLSIQVQHVLISITERYAYVLLSKSCQTID